MRHRLQRLWYQKPTSVVDRVLSAGLVPLSLAYRAGLAVSQAGVEPQVIGCPVVSVGNLTVGGSGKTPLVLELVKLLQDRGARVAVISRGYGRRSRGCLIVNRPGRDPEPVSTGGDEPVLIARRCPQVPVVVGEDRVEAGRLAVSEFSPDVVVCDDAFQHRRLKRDLDILAIHAALGLGNGRLLPRGPLREPRQAVNRSDLAVFTHAGDQSLAGLQDRHRLDPELPVAGLGLEPGGFSRGPALEPAELERDTPVVAACGIANPQGFFDLCGAAGLQLVGARSFPDHHRLSDGELSGLDRFSRDCGARAIVVTEKDLVGLGRTPGMPILALSLTGRWTDQHSRDTMESLLAARVGH